MRYFLRFAGFCVMARGHAVLAAIEVPRIATSGSQFGINYAGTDYTQRRRQAKWDQGSDKTRPKPFPKL